LEDYRALVDEVRELSTDLILRVGLCPDLPFELNAAQLLSQLGQIGGPFGQMEQGISDMETRLATYGCDQQEVEEQGNQMAQSTADPEVAQGGGTGAEEICGDGIDNDGDGLQDEDCAGQGSSNIAILLYDSGSAKDDVFALAVTGQGNLGNTPAGGARSYSLSLPPGSYIATVTVISAPDNIGTFTITIAEGDKVIASQSGGPAQGTQIPVPFTVGQAGTGSSTSFAWPIMDFGNEIPEEGIPRQREGDSIFGNDDDAVREMPDTRGQNSFLTKRRKPTKRPPD
jgi:hypothetical protein